MNQCEALYGPAKSAGLNPFQSRANRADGARDYWGITLKGKANPALSAGLGFPDHAGNRAPIALPIARATDLLLKKNGELK